MKGIKPRKTHKKLIKTPKDLANFVAIYCFNNARNPKKLVIKKEKKILKRIKSTIEFSIILINVKY